MLLFEVHVKHALDWIILVKKKRKEKKSPYQKPFPDLYLSPQIGMINHPQHYLQQTG